MKGHQFAWKTKVWTRTDLAGGDEFLWCGVSCLVAAIDSIDTEKMHGKLLSGRLEDVCCIFEIPMTDPYVW